MNTPIPVIVDGQAGIFAHSKARVATLNAKAKERLCLMDARIRTLMAEPEEGAATANTQSYSLRLQALRRCWSPS